MNDGARLCHAMAVRIQAGADPDRLARNLARIPAAERATLWVETVEAGCGTPAAARRRERELERPLDPHAGPPLRAVLLRYDDGVSDLVLVMHRGSVGALEPLAGAILAGSGGVADGAAPVPEGPVAGLRRVEAASSPDWGLGDPASGAATGRLAFDLPVPAGAPDEPSAPTLLAALGLVLARYEGRRPVAVGGPHPLGAVLLDPAPDQTIDAYLRSVRDAVDGSAAPEEAPLVGLVISRSTSGFVADGIAAEWLEYRPFLAPVHPLSIHVSIHVREDGRGSVSGVCSYERRSFDPQVAEQFVRHFTTAYGNLLGAGREAQLASVELFAPAERQRIAGLGGAGRPFPVSPDCIHRAVAARAAETPDAVAVRHGEEQLTYRELEERANRAAHALRAQGIGAQARVGVCLERSLDLVVVLLAVLKSGAAYVPMDPAYPSDRLAFTAEDAGLTVVVTTLAAFPASPRVRVLDPGSLVGADAPVAPPADLATPDDAAYVIYTSGSTGRPKGVTVAHRNVVSLLAATRDDFALGPADIWTLFHSSAFDFSVWEIWGCLMTGGRLVVVPFWVSRSPEDFASLLAAERVTILSQTPSAFTQLMEADRSQRLTHPPRLVVFGGEPLDTGPLLAWFDRHPEWECRLVNMFGITETTVHVTAQTLSRREALTGSRSVGRALPGWSVYVMDAQGQLVPPGVAGEIYVGGAGVAEGYLNRPELTAQRFLADPFSGGRMYRSGDRGRLLPDGRLEHLGRLDGQVKVRGHRIELGEIRARLLDAPAVAAAVVVLRERVRGDRASAQLDAYVVFRGGKGDVAQVRRQLVQFLPGYMVPATVTPLPALPLTPNGKVDLARLPDPVKAPSSVAGRAEHDGTVASAVRQAWETVFGVQVDPDDDFFSLGGNSLLAVRLSAALRDRGLPQIALRELYLNPTVNRLARVFGDAALDRKKSA
jgi:amino acid adenylation domain-containing protein